MESALFLALESGNQYLKALERFCYASSSLQFGWTSMRVAIRML